MKIGFIGFGKMGFALAKAMKYSGEKEISCFDRNREILLRARKYGFKTADSNVKVAKGSDIVFVCVKPQDLQETLRGMKGFLKGKILASIAAGKKISFLEKNSGAQKIVRVMPNINALAGVSANVFACKNLNAKEKTWVKKLLGKCGTAIEMPESQFDAVTALSGSGPAFTAYFIKCLADAGGKNGLPEKTAYLLALETVYGTAKLLKGQNIEPEQLVEMVSSPNGTTVAGRKVLEKGAFKKIVFKTLAAARKRSIELGK